jgi:hypothetical protein
MEENNTDKLICPLSLSNGYETYCREYECAWYDIDSRKCIVLSLKY